MSDINFGDPFPTMTAEDLESAAEQRFSPTPAPEAGLEGGEETHTSPPSAQSEEVVVSDSIRIGERDYSRADVEAWANFDSLLRSDPKLGQVIYSHLYGSDPSGGVGTAPVAGGNLASPAVQPGWGSPGVSPAPSPVSSTPPPSSIPQVDPELLADPGFKFLYDRMQQQDELLNNYQAEIRRLGSITSSRVQADSKSVIETVVGEFKTQYGVDDQTVRLVQEAAARLEVIPSILNRGIDPITGQPTDPNPLNAVRRAMEVAAYSIPEIRERIMQNQTLLQQQDAQRKSRLSAIGGSSRPIPRNTPAPTNSQDIRAAMVQEVAAAMNGNGHGE